MTESEQMGARKGELTRVSAQLETVEPSEEERRLASQLATLEAELSALGEEAARTHATRDVLEQQARKLRPHPPEGASD